MTAVLLTFVFVGCSDSSDGKEPTEPSTAGSVIGSWHLKSWSALQNADIYLTFSEAGTFELYQRVYKPQYVHYNGSFSFEKSVLSGKYGDQTPWGDDYKVSFRADGNEMRLTATSSTGDVSIFVKSEIPEEILSGALEGDPKSRSEEPRFL